MRDDILVDFVDFLAKKKADPKGLRTDTVVEFLGTKFEITDDYEDSVHVLDITPYFRSFKTLGFHLNKYFEHRRSIDSGLVVLRGIRSINEE